MLTRHNAALALGCLLGLARAAAAADFEGQVDYMVTSEGRSQPLSFLVRGPKARIDVNGGQAAAIIDGDAHTQVVLMPARKMYMSMAVQRSVAESADKQSRPTALRKTGKRETIAGVACEVYAYKNEDGEGELCNARGLGRFLPVQGGPGGGGWPFERVLAGSDVFPLRINHRGKDGPTQLLATKVDRRSIDPALFQPPADYRPFALPQGAGAGAGLPSIEEMQRMTPEQRQKLRERLQQQHGKQ